MSDRERYYEIKALGRKATLDEVREMARLGEALQAADPDFGYICGLRPPCDCGGDRCVRKPNHYNDCCGDEEYRGT